MHVYTCVNLLMQIANIANVITFETQETPFTIDFCCCTLVLYTSVEPLYCGHLADLVKSLVYIVPFIVYTLGTW